MHHYALERVETVKTDELKNKAKHIGMRLCIFHPINAEVGSSCNLLGLYIKFQFCIDSTSTKRQYNGHNNK